MEYEYVGPRRRSSVLPMVFRTFVCVSLAALLGMHLYAYLWGSKGVDSFDSEFSDIKFIVMQLTRGLTEVSRKHEHLSSELERISDVLPAMAAAAGRAKDALEPTRRTREREIDVYNYDREVIDYALGSAGARVLDTGDTVDHVHHDSVVSWGVHVLTSWLCQECLGARAILHPGSLPGECWAFKGSRGEATILLLGTVFVTGVSLEHIPANISPTRETSSAPRVFTLEGLESKTDKYPHEFGTFEYQIYGKPIQYFPVETPSTRGYNIVRLKFLSNWGNQIFTCVYRVRVHGTLTPGHISSAFPIDDDAQIETE